MKRLAAIACCALALIAAGCGGSNSSTAPGATKKSTSHTTTVPAPTRVEASLAPWTLPIPLSRPAVTVLGNQIVAASGLTKGDVSTNDVFLVDPAAGTVTTGGHLAAAVHDAAAVVHGSNVFVIAGGGASITSAVQSWAVGAASAKVGALSNPRADLVAATVNDRSFVLGGTDGKTLQGDVLATADGRTFSTVGRLAQPVRYPAVVVEGSVIWLFGGETQATEGGAAIRTDLIQKFNTTDGSSAVVGRLPQAMSHAMAFSLGGAVFVAGGRDANGARATVLAVHADGTTADAGSLPGSRSDAGVATTGDATYLVGGEVAGPADALTSSVVVHTAS